MRKWKKRIAALITRIMEHLPGGELRNCKNISPMNTECIEHLGHRGKCEDAWFQMWNPEDSI
jgi:hypothetical protein